MLINCHAKYESDRSTGSSGQVLVDHDAKWVTVQLYNVSVRNFPPISISPAEAKAMASALVHYAERAQTIRDREDEFDLKERPT